MHYFNIYLYWGMHIKHIKNSSKLGDYDYPQESNRI